MDLHLETLLTHAELGYDRPYSVVPVVAVINLRMIRSRMLERGSLTSTITDIHVQLLEMAISYSQEIISSDTTECVSRKRVI